ncbi:MAG: hypothetical protein AABX03_00775 [Nanoarchaeota archaeon]
MPLYNASAKEGLTFEEVISYAMEILLPEYRTPEKVRAYAINLINEKADSDLRKTLKRGSLKDFVTQINERQTNVFPKIEGNVLEILAGIGEIPPKFIKGAATIFRVEESKLLPKDKSPGEFERLEKAYEKIKGEPMPKKVEGEPFMYPFTVYIPLKCLLD